jgi:hypothetical protein
MIDSSIESAFLVLQDDLLGILLTTYPSGRLNPRFGRTRPR